MYAVSNVKIKKPKTLIVSSLDKRKQYISRKRRQAKFNIQS